jgi:hypothetical protein
MKKMKQSNFLQLMQRYVANIAISGTTLRNQGAKDVTKEARNFLAVLDLSELKTIQPQKYLETLNTWTHKLKNKLPAGAQNWGTARKAINVFMVQVFLNTFLSKEYGVKKFKDVLETPLDSYAQKELKRANQKIQLPKWDSIKSLTEEKSNAYQQCALEVANQRGICRACADIVLWRPEGVIE